MRASTTSLYVTTTTRRTTDEGSLEVTHDSKEGGFKVTRVVEKKGVNKTEVKTYDSLEELKEATEEFGRLAALIGRRPVVL